MSQLTMPLPEERPRADLSPIAKARAARRTRPDTHGTTAGIAWAVWEETTLSGQPEHVVAVMVDGEGQYIKQIRRDAYGGDSGKRLYRLHSSALDVQWTCIRIRMLDGWMTRIDPVESLRMKMRKRLEDKIRRIHHYRRELDHDQVASYYDEDGAHHRIKSA